MPSSVVYGHHTSILYMRWSKSFKEKIKIFFKKLKITDTFLLHSLDQLGVLTRPLPHVARWPGTPRDISASGPLPITFNRHAAHSQFHLLLSVLCSQKSRQCLVPLCVCVYLRLPCYVDQSGRKLSSSCHSILSAGVKWICRQPPYSEPNILSFMVAYALHIPLAYLNHSRRSFSIWTMVYNTFGIFKRFSVIYNVKGVQENQLLDWVEKSQISQGKKFLFHCILITKGLQSCTVFFWC